MPTLSSEHREALKRESGLSDEMIDKLGWYSVTKDEAAKLLGKSDVPSDGIAMPYPNAPGFTRVRYDTPRQLPNGRRQRYDQPVGTPNHAFILPEVAAILTSPENPVFITEGEKKAAKATQEGFHCIALPGVWGFRTVKAVRGDGYTPPRQQKGFLPELEAIAWKGRTVRILWDSDAKANENVMLAGRRLESELLRRGAKAQFFVLPAGPDGRKMGLDDFLITHGAKGLRDFLDEAAAEALNITRNFSIEALKKMERGEESWYYATVFGIPVRLEPDELYHYHAFRRRVMVQTNRLPDMDKPSENWPRYVDHVLQTKLTVEKVPEEASTRAVIWELVQKYLEKALDDPATFVAKKAPLRDEEGLFVRGEALLRFLSRQYKQKLRPTEVWDIIRERGAQMTRKWLETETGKRQIRCWAFPPDVLAEDNPEPQVTQNLDEELFAA